MDPASRRTQQGDTALRSENERLRVENERLRARLDERDGEAGEWHGRWRAFQRLVSSVLSTLVRAEPDGSDESVQRVLAMVSELTGAERICLLEPAGGGGRFSCRHVWTAVAAGVVDECVDRAPAGPGGVPDAADISAGDDLVVPEAVLASLRAGEVLTVPDVTAAPAGGAEAGRAVGWMARDARSLVAMPMISAGEMVGILDIEWLRVPRVWADDELALLEVLSEIFAHALVRKQVDAERLGHLRHLEDMARVTAAMEGVEDLELMLAAATEILRDTFGCARAFLVHPYQPDSGVLRLAAVCAGEHADPAFVAGREIAVDEVLGEVLQRALADKVPVTFGAGQDQPLLASSAARGVCFEMWLGLPVHLGGAWLLGLHRGATEPAWTAQERCLFADVGGRVADAIGTFLSSRNSRANEERFRSLLAAIPDLIFVFDAFGRYRDIFPMQHNQLVLSSDELRGKSLHEVMPPGVALMTQRLIDQAITSGELQQLEYALDLPGGKRWFSARLARFESGDDPCVICVARDITERRNLEEQLLQAQKMESVGRLAGGVAHDFNNLLTAVLAHAELAMEDLPEESEVRQDLGLIHDAASRGAALTRQLLTFARKQVITPRVVNLNDLLLRVDAMLRRLIGAHIEFVTVPEPHLHTVKVDPVQFEQVLVNLAINARDAMPSGGKLILETLNTDIDIDVAGTHPGLAAGSYVVLSVTDTGVGMDEDTMTHIFEPFFTTKETGKGTGLGLATCYGIVKQCGGDLWVTSKLGVGTTFEVMLPRVDGPANFIEKDEVEGPLRAGSETVLVVEDEPMVRAVTVRTLRRYGYNVIEAANGDEALALDPERLAYIDLLLTDVVMPRMSGRQLAEQMRTICPGVRVLYVSGYTEDAVARHPMLEKGMEFLQKPFTPVLLARKVRELLDLPAPGTEPH